LSGSQPSCGGRRAGGKVSDLSAPLPGEDLPPGSNTAPRKKRVGRPPLPMRLRIEIAVAWGEEYANARVCVETPAPRRRAVERLQRKIEAAHREGVAPHIIKRLSDKLDAHGRYSRKIILPPQVALPDIDRVIAKRYGVTRRMVCRIRRDKRMWVFMPQLPWKVPDWQLQGMAQHVAKRLMTPQRYDKREQIALTGDGLAVEQVPGLESGYTAAWRVFGIQQRCEEQLPPEYRRPPVWLAHLPQWGQYFRKHHLAGRRIKPEAAAE
jgi:hypothetical protein